MKNFFVLLCFCTTIYSCSKKELTTNAEPVAKNVNERIAKLSGGSFGFYPITDWNNDVGSFVERNNVLPRFAVYTPTIKVLRTSPNEDKSDTPFATVSIAHGSFSLAAMQSVLENTFIKSKTYDTLSGAITDPIERVSPFFVDNWGRLNELPSCSSITSSGLSPLLCFKTLESYGIASFATDSFYHPCSSVSSAAFVSAASKTSTKSFVLRSTNTSDAIDDIKKSIDLGFPVFLAMPAVAYDSYLDAYYNVGISNNTMSNYSTFNAAPGDNSVVIVGYKTGMFGQLEFLTQASLGNLGGESVYCRGVWVTSFVINNLVTQNVFQAFIYVPNDNYFKTNGWNTEISGSGTVANSGVVDFTVSPDLPADVDVNWAPISDPAILETNLAIPQANGSIRYVKRLTNQNSSGVPITKVISCSVIARSGAQFTVSKTVDFLP